MPAIAPCGSLPTPAPQRLAPGRNASAAKHSEGTIPVLACATCRPCDRELRQWHPGVGAGRCRAPSAAQSVAWRARPMPIVPPAANGLPGRQRNRHRAAGAGQGTNGPVLQTRRVRLRSAVCRSLRRAPAVPPEWLAMPCGRSCPRSGVASGAALRNGPAPCRRAVPLRVLRAVPWVKVSAQALAPGRLPTGRCLRRCAAGPRRCRRPVAGTARPRSRRVRPENRGS